MTKPKGRRVAALPDSGSAPKRRKNARDRTAAASLALMTKPTEGGIGEREAACDEREAEFVRRLEQQSKKEADFAKRQEQQSRKEAEFVKRQEQQSKREADFAKPPEQLHLERAASLKAREEALRRREAAFVAKREREVAGAEVGVTPRRQARQAAASSMRDELGRRTGALLDASQSRDILLLYYGLVKSGMEENPAAKRTAELLRVGKGKVFKIRAHWNDRREFLTSSGQGRGAASAEDGRRKSAQLVA